MARRLFAAVVGLAVLGGLLLVARGDDDAPATVRALAPAILPGDLDATIVAATFDDDGARAPLPADLVAKVADVAGIASAEGVVQTFATGTWDASADLPVKSPLVLTYHEADELEVQEGGLPTGAGDVVVNADLARRSGSHVGDVLVLRLRGTERRLHVVGVAELAGAGATDGPLAFVSSAQGLEVPSYDRIDVTFADDADPVEVQAALRDVVGPDVAVLEPTALGYADQRLAQLDIQRAYWDTLSPDDAVRDASHADAVPDPAQAHAAFERFADQTRFAELRVERVSFLSPDEAALTYRIYYGGDPSPAFPEPQQGEAVRIDGRWKVAGSTQCSLAALVANPCAGGGSRTPRPPSGWKDVASLDPAVGTAFAALADPDATPDARLAALDHADPAAVADGLADDRQWHGKVRTALVGWRDDGGVQVLYAVSTDDGPTTPYPLRAQLVEVDGALRFPASLACGLRGLAAGGCPIARVGG
jgi:hypothetical protein